MDEVPPHRLQAESSRDEKQQYYRKIGLSGLVMLLLVLATCSTNPTNSSSNFRGDVVLSPMETDDHVVDTGGTTETATSSTRVNIGMGCPEFQLAFDSATAGSSTPFRSFTLTKGSGYAYVGVRFSKLWMPIGVSVVLRAVEGFDTPDRMLNLSKSFPSGRNYGNVAAPPVLTKEFRIEFYRSDVGSSTVDEDELIAGVFNVVDNDSKCFGFVVDSYEYALMNDNEPLVANEASICAGDNTKNAICYYADNTTRTAYLASRSVARLKIPKGSGESASCTGWLIGNQGHVMTNFHCVSSDAEAQGTSVEFMAEDKSCMDSFSCGFGECEGEKVASTTELVFANEKLDYALLKLPKETAQKYGYLRLKTRRGVVGEQLYIPQHPMGKNKRLAVADDYATNVALVSLSASTCGTDGYSYSGDTQTGSSGSPVISFADHGVVALHHCGEMCANTGIPAHEIVADLVANKIDLAVFDGIDFELEEQMEGRIANAERFPAYIPSAVETVQPLTTRLTLDGAIILASGFVTMDKVEFTLKKDTIVSFSIISVEIADNDTFVDINGDCRASYLDSVLYLFEEDVSTPLFFVDDSNVNDFVRGGSVSYRDPHKTTLLEKGSYILVVAPTGSNEEDALDGKMKSNDAPELYTCQARSSYGSYKLKISSTVGDNPFQFTSVPPTIGIDPTQCHKAKEEICLTSIVKFVKNAQSFLTIMADQLSARVFLAFDDTSRAGKHVLHFAKFDDTQAVQMPQNIVEKLLPADLTPYVQIFQYPGSQASVVTVNTAILPATQRWELSDALVSALSGADVQELTILGALHLPYAKDDGLNVFYGGLNGTAAEDVDVTKLPAFGLEWEMKDPWLATFLHFIKAEQWPRTHLLLAKGFKPGRDLTGTYEAVDKLSRALGLFTKQKVTVDVEEVQRELPRLLAKEKTVSTAGDDHLTLLYH